MSSINTTSTTNPSTPPPPLTSSNSLPTTKKKIRFVSKGYIRRPDIPLRDPITGWTPSEKRIGVIGIKLGMIHEWDQSLKLIPLTVIQIPSCQVLEIKTKKKDGIDAVILAAGPRSPNKVKSTVLGKFIKAGFTEAKRKITQFRVSSPLGFVPVGTQILARHFTPGQFVDISGKTKGKGFQGVMKKYGFAGQPASHGTSLAHRSLGSTGNRKSPGRVFKGKKMPGQMGNVRRTIKNLLVYKINTQDNMIFVHGAVPGSNGSFVEVKDATFSPIKTFIPPFPTYFPKQGVIEPEELVYDNRVPMIEKDEWLMTQAEKNDRATKQRVTAPQMFASLADKLFASQKMSQLKLEANDPSEQETISEIFKRERTQQQETPRLELSENSFRNRAFVKLKSKKQRESDSLSQFGVALHGESDDQISLNMSELYEDSADDDDGDNDDESSKKEDKQGNKKDNKKKEKPKERKKEKKADFRKS